MGTRPALRRSRRRRRAPAGPPRGLAGHEPRVALLAGPGGGGSPDPADHRGDARRRRDRPRLAHGRRRLSAVYGRRPCAARLREDGGPRRPGLRAWRGPGSEPARSARRQHPARLGRGRPPPRERRRGRRLPRVDQGRSGHARLYLRGLSELDARRQRRPDADGVPCALRYLALVCSRGEGQEIAGTAGAELASETVRLWGAGTLPGHRGRGAYRALVMERCRHAHALGATLALTKANTATSAPILRNAGFRPVASERRYALKIAAQASPPG